MEVEATSRCMGWRCNFEMHGARGRSLGASLQSAVRLRIMGWMRRRGGGGMWRSMGRGASLRSGGMGGGGMMSRCMGVVIEVGSVRNFARLAALRTGLGERVKKVVTRVLVRRLEVENRKSKIENR